MLLAMTLLVFGVRYTKVPPAQIAWTHRTHVCVVGTVTAVRHEADGDWHVIVAEGAAFVVVEIVPRVPVARPATGLRIRLCGIRRYDDAPGHGWWELHPVIDWRQLGGTHGHGAHR